MKSISNRSITFTHGEIPLRKVWTLLSSQLWIKYYHCCYGMMDLALNNPILYSVDTGSCSGLRSGVCLSKKKKTIYGTRPCCLVQAITRHTSPDPHLGSWNCLAHQANIALSEPMSSIDQQGSSLGSFPTPPPLYPHFNRPSGFWPCIKPCLVGDIGKYQYRAIGLMSSVFANGLGDWCSIPSRVITKT